MKKFNLLALIVLVSVNILTPISYAGEIPDNEVESPENVVGNVVESVEDSQDPLEISERQEEPELLQIAENDEETKGKSFTLSDRGVDVSASEGDGTTTSGCYQYKTVEGGIEIVKYNVGGANCPNEVNLSNGIYGNNVVSIGEKAFSKYIGSHYETIQSIILGDTVKNIGAMAFAGNQEHHLEYIRFGTGLKNIGWSAFNTEDYNVDVEFPEGFDYDGLQVEPNGNWPWFIIKGGENDCFSFDVGGRQIYKYLCDENKVTIPEKIGEFTVEGIYGYNGCNHGGAFDGENTGINGSSVTSIIVPDSLKSVGIFAACPYYNMCLSSLPKSQEIEVQDFDGESGYQWNQPLVGIKPYPGSELSSSITDEMLNAACMYRLESHTIEFYNENKTLLTGITVEGIIDESDFPEIEDEEGYGHSWVDKDGNPYNGEIVSEDLKLYLKINKVGISHDEVNGIIKISDGENEYWLRDRNVGASISTGINKKDLLMDLAQAYANYNCGLISIEASESTSSRLQEFLQKASEIIGANEILTCDEILSFIDNFDQVEYRKSFGNYYFWGNNSYITYNEMNFNENGYSTTVTEPESNIRLGKIHEDNTGWEEGKTSNPCDASKGEYLPTPKDWENLMRAWANLNGETIDNAENSEGRYQDRNLNTLRANPSELTHGRIGFHNYESYNKFADDVLLPFAGGINYQLITNHCASAVGSDCNMTYKYRYHNYPSSLRTTRNNIGSIGLYEIYEGESYRSHYENLIDRGYEDEAYPVRCFIIANPATVQFDRYEGGDVESYKVAKGATITEPATPTKTGYTFAGWYTENEKKWDFDKDIVQGDMTLKAKWRVCGEGFTVIGNNCIPDGVNIDGIIEVSDGNDVVYVRDRNVGATNIVLTDEMRGHIDDLVDEMCEITYNGICVGSTEESDSCTKDAQCTDEFYEEVSDTLRYKIESIEELDTFMNNYEYESSYGNYYFWGNNSGTKYNDLEIDNNGNINMSKLDEKFLEGGKLGNSEGNGWIEGEIQNNPCDANKGEYLPTPEDWTRLITIWANKNGYDTGEFNLGQLTPIDLDEPKSLHTSAMNSAGQLYFPSEKVDRNFAQDMLIPGAGIINYNREGCAAEVGANCDKMYYRNLQSYLWMAQDKNGYVGGFAGYGIFYDTVDLHINMKSNDMAFPVRCFVNAPEVLVVTLVSDGQETREVNVVSGEKLGEPSVSQRNGYTFEGWYTKDGNKYNFNTPFTEDVTLYAKWTENKGNGSSGGGGGGSSTNKTDTTKEEKTNENTEKTEQTEQTPAEPQEENDTQKSQVNPQGGQNSSQGSSNYSEESQEAYKFAYKHGITTKPTIEEANMDGPLTRIQMAKMLSQYAINVLGKTPDESIVAKFNDVTGKRDRDYNNGVTLAYQLGIMGINMPNNKFRPDDIVTRGEFVTAFSRMLFNTSDGEYKSTPRYYVHHMEKLKNEGIVTKDNPKMEERRGYVMIMLMRSVTK